MKRASLTTGAVYEVDKPGITVLMKTATTKEIRITMNAGQLMKEHKAPYPIVVEVFEGALNFGVAGEVLQMKKGDLIALDANVPHDLKCVEKCIVRLSVSVADSIERVKKSI